MNNNEIIIEGKKIKEKILKTKSNIKEELM